MNGKPLPAVTAESRAYWEAAAEGRLLYQFCAQCSSAQFPPGARCRKCGSSTLEWRPSGGKGSIFSLTVVHRAPSAAFRPETPYTLALVDLDEGFRIMACVRGDDHLEARIGDEVSIIFEPIADGVKLPQAVRRHE